MKLFSTRLKLFGAFTALLLPFFIASQGFSVKKGNEYYEKLNYKKAIPYYENAVKSDSGNTEALVKLAECYRQTNNIIGQKKCYHSLKNNKSLTDKQNFYFAQTLMATGDLQMAKTFYEKIDSKSISEYKIKGIENIKFYSRNDSCYKVDFLEFNSNENDFSPVLTEKNELIFTSSRKRAQLVDRKDGWTEQNFYDIYKVKHDNHVKFSKVYAYSKPIDTKYNDGPLTLDKKNKKILFTRNQLLANNKTIKSEDGSVKLKIMEGEIDSTSNKIINVKELFFNNKEYNFAHPAISKDGNKLFFSSDKPGGLGGMDIYYCEKKNDKWSEPVNAGNEINTPGNEIFPYLDDVDVLYFSSDARDGLGGLDIYKSIKNGDKYTTPINMGSPINSNTDDFGICVDNSNKIGYLSSNRKNGNLNDDIYRFTIISTPNDFRTLKLSFKDKISGEKILGIKVFINNKTYTTNKNGDIIIEDIPIFDAPVYQVSTENTNYTPVNETINTNNYKLTELDINKEIVLNKQPKFGLLATIKDAKTQEPLEDVELIFKDLKSSETFTLKTDKSGSMYRKLENKVLGDIIAYQIDLKKTDYVTKSLTYNEVLKIEGDQKLHEKLDINLGKIEVGTDLAKLIDIKPIYFDVNKAVIKADASKELDKITKLMNEYPNMVIELGSHTDCRSSMQSNLILSDKRAKASAAYIKKYITNPSRIYGKGYGESKLKNNCSCEGKVISTCSEEEHQENRRTEFIIIKIQ